MWPTIFRRTMVWLLTSILAMSGAALVLPLLSDVFWAFELPGHFRAQVSVVTVAVTLGLVVARAWRPALLGFGLAVIIAAPVVALWVPDQTGDADGSELDVLSLNVSFYGRNQALVSDLLQRLQPDVVGLVEVDRGWIETLGSLDGAYPYRLVESAERRSGTALLSKIPLAAPEIRPIAKTRLLAATIRVDERAVVIGVIHTASPLWGERAALRDEQLRGLSALGHRPAERDLILMGDFNTSPWSLAFRRLIRQTGLRNAAAGFGYLATWPVPWPALGIPIDHCLVSDGITVREFDTVGPTGSDHLAIWARLSLGSDDPGASRK